MRIVEKLKTHKVLVICIVVLALWLVALLWFYKPCCWLKQASTLAETGNVKEVSAQNGVVQIPISEVTDGTLHYYKYNASNVWVRFFVIKGSQSGNIKTAFDACGVCGSYGYTKDGNYAVCKKCGMKFSIENIGTVTGGCNPIPLNATLGPSYIIISAVDIESGRQYFD